MGSAVVALFNGALQIWVDFLVLIYDVVTKSPYNFGNGALYSTISGLTDTVIKTAGVDLVMIVWGIGFVRLLFRSNTMNDAPIVVIGSFIRMIITTAIVLSYSWIVSFVIDWGISLTSAIAGSASAVQNAITFDETMLSSGFWEGMVDLILALVFFLVVAYMGIKILITVYARIFKMYVAIFLAPIPLALYASERTESMAIKYLTTVGRISLQGLVIVIDIVVYNVFLTQAPSLISFSAGGTLTVFCIVQFINIMVLSALIQASDQFIERLI